MTYFPYPPLRDLEKLLYLEPDLELWGVLVLTCCLKELLEALLDHLEDLLVVVLYLLFVPYVYEPSAPLAP